MMFLADIFNDSGRNPMYTFLRVSHTEQHLFRSKHSHAVTHYIVQTGEKVSYNKKWKPWTQANIFSTSCHLHMTINDNYILHHCVLSLYWFMHSTETLKMNA